ncbi:MAG: HipA domain-containing protein [Kiritimatiellae bacterium]|nr:HipA domain-containing protein [Kiritimatiellia bacterium]MBR2938382.1 HipA domain-containing protein [Kiritimatiellia bacterium]
MKRIEVFISEGNADRRLGTLEFDELRGKEVSSFELDGDFVLRPSVEFLGPDIGLFRGKQYPTLQYGFGLFQDAAPDSWGRKIIRRREKRGSLRESDYLLGVFDLTRVGALRFKIEGSDVFVNSDGDNPAPPWTTLRMLEGSSRRFEEDDADESALAVLLRPGTSLGGARPKASVTAPDGSLWIAKFPSKEDDFDTGAWEYLVHILAEESGICVPEAQAQKFSRAGTTFLCRRFDRDGSRRVPFASAMTMLGCEDRQEDGNGTYIDIAGFLMQHGAKPDADLPELWRRMAFSLLVSNTDDHLRNHGFIAENGRWRLSPAYDLNANLKRPQSLSLELDAGVPIEGIDVLVEAAEYFRLGKKDANAQLERIRSAVAKWRNVAARLGIPRREQEEMSLCFTSR